MGSRLALIAFVPQMPWNISFAASYLLLRSVASPPGYEFISTPDLYPFCSSVCDNRWELEAVNCPISMDAWKAI